MNIVLLYVLSQKYIIAMVQFQSIRIRALNMGWMMQFFDILLSFFSLCLHYHLKMPFRVEDVENVHLEFSCYEAQQQFYSKLYITL